MEQQTERQIQRQIKVQKRLKKMKKKQDKRRKKIEKRKAKRLKKLNKLKGVQEKITPKATAEAPKEAIQVSQEETFDIPDEAPPVEWERQSIIPIADVEQKVDEIFLKKEESGIKELWAQRYGEDLELPDTPRTFELSNEKKASLEKRRDAERKQAVVSAKKADSGKAKKKERKAKAPAADVKPWWDLRRLIIVHGFLPDAHILLKIIVILLIDLGLWIFLLPIRILYIVFVIMIMKKGSTA